MQVMFIEHWAGGDTHLAHVKVIFAVWRRAMSLNWRVTDPPQRESQINQVLKHTVVSICGTYEEL